MAEYKLIPITKQAKEFAKLRVAIRDTILESLGCSSSPSTDALKKTPI